LATPSLAGVAVLLLIGAVELQELLVLLAEMIAVCPQFLSDRAAQGTTVLLDPFHGRTTWLLDGPLGGSVRALMHFTRHSLNSRHGIFTKPINLPILNSPILTSLHSVLVFGKPGAIAGFQVCSSNHPNRRECRFILSGAFSCADCLRVLDMEGGIDGGS